MLYLESFLHRVELAEVVSRWIVNRPQPGDVAKLKKIVNFNSYATRLWADAFVRELFHKVFGHECQSFVAKTKGQLKDFIVDNPSIDTPRANELYTRYRRFPEDFYRETPFDGRVYYLQQGEQKRYVGSTRIKRFRRIAEKGSRRIVDYMFERIRASADALAEERAKGLGIPKDQLITPLEEQVAEFLHAERRLLKLIRRGSIQSEFPVLSIPDVVGIKVVTQGPEYEALLRALDAHRDCTLVEEERHVGRYNATNLRVSYRVPRAMLERAVPCDAHRRLLGCRGMDPATVAKDYLRFVREAEDDVMMEVIVSDGEEFLESEIGRSMHEDRIVQQRASAEYSSHLAINILHIMEYILFLCLAPSSAEVTDVPIKLWVKYMPDTIDRLQRGLFGLPADASFDDPNGMAQSGELRPSDLYTPPLVDGLGSHLHRQAQDQAQGGSRRDETPQPTAAPPTDLAGIPS